MKRILISCVTLSVLLNCSNERSRGDALTSDHVQAADSLATETDKILYKNEVVRNFSSLDEKDSLKIHVHGKSLRDGNVTFKIISAKGKTIMTEIFPARLLLNYGIEPEATAQEEERYIRTRIDEFFLEMNFAHPAIQSADTFEEDYSDRKIWDDISSDSTSVGFYYLLGEEDGRHIAYSKRLKKVVIYFNCC